MEPAEDSAEYGAVAVAPPPGTSLALHKVPRAVQQLEAPAIRELRSLSLADSLDARLSGITLNQVQNNPLQPDIQYRGFTASPLLGSPQGIALYQNGVRINEPFGDVVQWDLVPEFAVAGLQLLPGANPLYGRNALGGSLVLRTKDGFRNPGHRVEALGGSFARYDASAEYGASSGDVAFYAGVSAFGEHGFREASPSQARQLFADVRHRSERHEAGINLTLADTDLTGNGPAPIELLAADREAVFTYPDITRNALLMTAADFDYEFTKRISAQATAYVRNLDRATVNGDEGEFELCEGPGGEVDQLCDEEGELLLSEAGLPITTRNAFTGVFNTTDTASLGYGANVQLTVDEPIAAFDNQFVAGVSYDGAEVDFLQRAELGFLTDQRSVEGSGEFIAGDEFRTDLRTENQALGVYAAETFNVLPSLALSAAARFSLTRIELHDRLGEALEGDHTFTRVNPSFGIAFTPVDALTVFASYGEATRAPSAAELACADPDEPCRVPNAFVADPPLEQVVSRSVEIGVRGAFGGTASRPALAFSLAGFGSRNADDIIFVSASRPGTGYFRNAGTTQRVGLELALHGEAGPVRFYAGYSLLRATFEDELVLPGAAHPDAIEPEAEDEEEEGEEEEEEEGGVIEVEPGDRLPGLPTHSVKAGVAVTPIERLELGLRAVAQSGQRYRGDEANLLPELDGYVVLTASASYRIVDELTLFVKADNLLDSRYETFGVIADPSEVLPEYTNPRFVSPGPPFALWAGIVIEGP